MKFTILFFAVVLLVTACRQRKDSADEKMQKELAGTWTFEARFAWGSTVEQTMTVGPDGSYVLTIEMPSRTNGPRTISMEGTLRVEGGFLVDTVMKNSQTNAPVPSTNVFELSALMGRSWNWITRGCPISITLRTRWFI